jgi:NAD(P)-dependent dehydrogenase (short-subunit alcohol dehydrogenase family)
MTMGWNENMVDAIEDKGSSKDNSPYATLGPPLGELFDLARRTAVVTGGGAGIGRAVAIGLAYFGADVVVVDKEAALAQRVADDVAAIGRRSRSFAVDITNLTALERVAATVVDEWGGLDICVASAGGGLRRGIFETTPELWRQVVDLNLAGTWNTARAFGRSMVDRGHGKFISIASIHGHVGDPGQSAYAPAKAGIVGLTKVLALEWAAHNVQVNCIAPSHIKTQRVQSILDNPEEYARLRARSPVGRFGEAWELVGPAIFLASDASSFVTGHSLLVDGGWTAT